MSIRNHFSWVAWSMLALSPLTASGATANSGVKVSGERISVESSDDELRVRSFHARKHASRVEGNAVFTLPGPGDDLDLKITCVRVVDADTLVIGGFFQEDVEFLPAGTQAVFAVRDGGSGDEARDFLSALHRGSCECDQPLATLQPIEGGDIEVDEQ